MDVRLHWAGKLSKTCEESRGGPRAYVSLIIWGIQQHPWKGAPSAGRLPLLGCNDLRARDRARRLIRLHGDSPELSASVALTPRRLQRGGAEAHVSPQASENPQTTCCAFFKVNYA